VRAAPGNDRQTGADFSSAWAYGIREGLELCLVVGGLVLVDGVLRVPLWVWVVLLGGKASMSALFYVLFLRRKPGQTTRYERQPLIGRTAYTLSPLNPDGQIGIDGEIWSARSRSGTVIPSGHAVRIHGACRNTLLVDTE
jgi:membrane protein implicated in regulation of membrane protease activity